MLSANSQVLRFGVKFAAKKAAVSLFGVSSLLSFL